MYEHGARNEFSLIEKKEGGKISDLFICTFKATLSSFSLFGATMEKVKRIWWEKNNLRDRHVSNRRILTLN